MIESKHSFLSYKSSCVSLSLRFLASPWMGGLLGLIFFIAIFGVKILNPTYVDWMLNRGGDLAGQFVGWDFFRKESWHFPLGFFQNYGYPVGTSMVYMDGVPFLAFIFKLLSPIFPNNLQYYGLWIASCYVMQGACAWLLVGRFIQSPVAKTIATLFFLFSPLMLVQLNLGHVALGAQWLILLALYLYFESGTRKALAFWTVLIFAAAFIQVYLMAMILPIWFAFLVKNALWGERVKWGQSIAYVVIVLATAGLIMWVSGYFIMAYASTHTMGFGDLSMNLLAPFSPTIPGWSNILPSHASRPGQYEGFNYFGFGTLLLFLAVFYKILKNPSILQAFKSWLPLFAAALLLTAHALSNHITLGTYTLFSYSPPHFILALQSTFRSSGRFFWMSYYLLMTWAFAVLFHKSYTQKTSVFLGLILLVQIFDFSTGIAKIHASYTHLTKSEWNNPLQSPFWEEAAHHYKHILFVPRPTDAERVLYPIAHYAARYGLTLNDGYFSRRDEALAVLGQSLKENFFRGKLSPDSLYIVNNNKLLLGAMTQFDVSDKVLEVDGFTVVAPGWLRSSKDNISSETLPLDYSILPSNVMVNFSTTGNGKEYLLDGWSVPEQWGIWSDGKEALLGVRLPNIQRAEMLFKLQFPYKRIKGQPSSVVVWVNHVKVAVWELVDTKPQQRRIQLSAPGWGPQKDNYFIRFEFSDPKSPAELGLSADRRRLGIGLINAQIISVQK